jgi:hypothetical protein
MLMKTIGKFKIKDKYLSVSEHIDKLVNSKNPAQTSKKPWWKIW